MTQEVEMCSDVTVKLVRCLASDSMVVQAAQVSVKGENKPGTDSPRLINYLMEAKHGSPFEHNIFTFFVEAPIFVFREWHRHRIASINEMSGRYTKLLPKFYTPKADRNMINIGTSARPDMSPGTKQQRSLVYEGDKYIAEQAWHEYENRLEMGVANELARTVLPVSIYSQQYWTVNARSLMNFISLRIDDPRALNRTRPQWEIQMGAEQVEDEFCKHMPLTHEAFIKNGRVAP